MFRAERHQLCAPQRPAEGNYLNFIGNPKTALAVAQCGAPVKAIVSAASFVADALGIWAFTWATTALLTALRLREACIIIVLRIALFLLKN